MTPQQTTEILELVDHLNAVETQRLTEYHTYLSGRTPQPESIALFKSKYGRFMQRGQAATAHDIEAMEGLLSMPVPPDLQTFFQTVGGLSRVPLKLFSAPELLRFLQNNSPLAGTPASDAASSMGLLDLIKLNWGNDRFELDAINGIVEQADIDLLNARYACVGWFTAAGDDESESATYVYFDRSGNYGTLFYHQDDFEELWDASLQPMLTSSPAQLKFADIAIGALRTMAGHSGE